MASHERNRAGSRRNELRRGDRRVARRPPGSAPADAADAIEALRESEAKYRRLHETRIDAFVSVSMDGRIQESNELFQRMLGYTAEELRALTYLDLTPAEWHEFEAEIIEKQVLKRGHSELYQKEYRRKNGTIFPIELRTILIRDGSGAAIGMWAVVRDITERKKAEQALIESREALADAREELLALINSTSDFIWSVDPRTFGLITYNEALRHYFQKRGIDIRPGMTPTDLLPPEFAERWRQFYLRALHDGPFVEQYLTASGIPVLLLSVDPVRRGGTVSAISVFGKDITERIKSEEALRNSARRFRTLIEDAPIAIRLSRDDRTLYANQRYLSLFGYADVNELVGKPVVDQWAPEDREAHAGLTKRFALGQAAAREYEGTAVRRDGTRFPAHVALGPVQLPDGGAVIAYVSDITERKAAETALKQTEERFRQVAETVSDFIWEVDAQGLYTYTNNAVRKILGYSPNELIGQKHFYDLFAEDVREELKKAALEVFASRQPFRAFPNPNVSKDGRLVHLETSGTPLLDESGRLLGYRGADSDVSERWLNEEAMRDLTGRLINAQEAERTRLGRELHDDFSQRLALFAIDLYMLAQSPPSGVEQLRASLKGLYDEANALTNDIHRMSHDLHPARLEQLGLGAALSGLCRDLSASHPVRIRYEAHAMPRNVPPPVALALYRVAQEALQNVIKHSDAGIATVELTGGADEIRLIVQDDGRGIDVAAAQRGGSLGLVSMRERVRSIGGRFAIAPAPGGGTRVDVFAPLVPPA